MADGISFRSVDKPRGIFPARIDDKGRMKLPVDIHRYLTQIGADTVFVTSFDEQVGRIYPIPIWKEVEAMFRDSGEDSEAAEGLAFTANNLGADSDVDSQGRLLMPAKLRKALDLENQTVHLQHFKEHIRIYSEPVYLEMQQRSREDRAEKLKTFERKGLL